LANIRIKAGLSGDVPSASGRTVAGGAEVSSSINVLETVVGTESRAVQTEIMSLAVNSTNLSRGTRGVTSGRRCNFAMACKCMRLGDQPCMGVRHIGGEAKVNHTSKVIHGDINSWTVIIKES